MTKENFSQADLVVLDEIVGGRYDSLKELADQYPRISNRKQLLADIEKLRPLVEKIRRQLT